MGATKEEQEVVLAFGWSGGWVRAIRPLVESAGPPRRVYLDAFFIDKYEVTNIQYGAFVLATGHSPPAFGGTPDHPVLGVSWYDAEAFCGWAGKGLPTEAQWEKAARGTDGLSYPWGEDWDSARLRSAEEIARRPVETFSEWTDWQQTSLIANLPGPVAVGRYLEGASPYGVMDMAGNVWEWVADWYGRDYYSIQPRRNPLGPDSGERRVLRGGAWDVPRVVAHTWTRETFITPGTRSFVAGFRCAMDQNEDES